VIEQSHFLALFELLIDKMLSVNQKKILVS